MVKKEAEKNETVALAQEILGKCHPDAVTVIRHWITIIQSRWEEVSAWANQVCLINFFSSLLIVFNKMYFLSDSVVTVSMNIYAIYEKQHRYWRNCLLGWHQLKIL